MGCQPGLAQTGKAHAKGVAILGQTQREVALEIQRSGQRMHERAAERALVDAAEPALGTTYQALGFHGCAIPQAAAWSRPARGATMVTASAGRKGAKGGISSRPSTN